MTDDALRRQRAMDFLIQKFCSEEARKAEELREYQKTSGSSWLIEYDADRAFRYIKEQQKAYDAAKESGCVMFKSNPAFEALSEAEILVSLLLDPQGKVYHRSSRAAAQQRKKLEWFAESPEFKDLVSSAVSRVV